MTDWAKWDKIVADLSDEEEEAAPPPRPVASAEVTPVGVGQSLTAEGRIQCLARPGNARGNALSTNAQPVHERPLTQFSWADEGAHVAVSVPLGSLAGTAAQGGGVAVEARCSFTPTSFDLLLVGQGGELHRLRVTDLPCGGLSPQACRHRVEAGPPEPRVVLTLVKAQPEARWLTLGEAQRAVSRPSVTLKDYRWCDEKMGVRIWVSVPGVHCAPESAVTVRFRELSFDVTVRDLHGKDFYFAVTELPMEVVVAECAYVVETDTVKLYLRKWARTGWRKLQLAR